VELSYAAVNSNHAATAIRAAEQALKLAQNDRNALMNLGWGYCMEQEQSTGMKQVQALEKVNDKNDAQRLQSYCSKAGAGQARSKK
jgi:cytochrome c-type biogenesis protein CcmH/NrfG